MPSHPDRVRRNYLPGPTVNDVIESGIADAEEIGEDGYLPHECQHCGAGPEYRLYSSMEDINYCRECYEDWP